MLISAFGSLMSVRCIHVFVCCNSSFLFCFFLFCSFFVVEDFHLFLLQLVGIWIVSSFWIFVYNYAMNIHYSLVPVFSLLKHPFLLEIYLNLQLYNVCLCVWLSDTVKLFSKVFVAICNPSEMYECFSCVTSSLTLDICQCWYCK